MELEYKCLPVSGFKVLEEDQGIIEAIVSVTGIVDRVKDNIKPGAYAKSLSTRKPKGVWGHDWNTPVSKTLAADELPPGHKDLPKTLPDGRPWPKEAGGVKVRTQFNLDTQAGREAYSNVLFFGEDQEWSIGYQVPAGAAKVDSKSGVRSIEYLDWYEYSPVLFGAMPFARNLTEKSFEAAETKDGFFSKPQMAFKALKDALGEDEALTYFKDDEHDHITSNPANKPGEGQTTNEAVEDGLNNRGDSTEVADVIEVETAVEETNPETGEKKMYPQIDGSLESRQEAIRSAVREKYTPKGNLGGPSEYVYVYLAATFDDYVIVSREGKGKTEHFRVSYTMDDDGNVTLADDAKPVKIRVQSTITEEKAGRVLSAGNTGLINNALEKMQEAATALSGLLASVTREPSSSQTEENETESKQEWNNLSEMIDVQFKDAALAEEDVTTLTEIAATIDEAIENEDSDAAFDAAEDFVSEVEGLLEETDDDVTQAALREVVTELGETLANLDSSEEEVSEEESGESEGKVLIRLSGSDDQQEQKDGEPVETKTLDLSRLATMRAAVKGRN